MRKLNGQLVEIAIYKFEEYLEGYKVAFNLQYGSLIKLFIDRNKIRHFDCWTIGFEKKGTIFTIAKIETNIYDNIFDIYINTSIVNFDSKELNQFNYQIIDNKSILKYSPVIEISTNSPSQLIDILVMCEKYISHLTSA